MTKTKVDGYKRLVNGKPHKVRSYSRKQRKKGNKLSYKKIGTFYAAYDEYGNLKGSRVVKTKPKKKKVIKKTKKK